jgi:hypothetical protein
VPALAAAKRHTVVPSEQTAAVNSRQNARSPYLNITLVCRLEHRLCTPGLIAVHFMLARVVPVYTLPGFLFIQVEYNMTTITYYLSIADLIAFHRYHYQTHHSQLESRSTRIMKSIFPLAILLPFLYYGYQSNILLTLSVGGPLLAIFIFGIWSYLRQPANLEAAIKQSVVKTYTNQHDSKFTNRNTIQITEQGIIADSGDTEATYKWRAINSIATTPEHAFLYFSEAEAIIIPRSAFADDQAFQAFFQFAQAHITPAMPSP